MIKKISFFVFFVFFVKIECNIIKSFSNGIRIINVEPNSLDVQDDNSFSINEERFEYNPKISGRLEFYDQFSYGGSRKKIIAVNKGNQLVGFCDYDSRNCFSDFGYEREIHYLNVADRYKNAHIGSALLACSAKDIYLSDKNTDSIRLNASGIYTNFEIIIGFYKKFGFNCFCRKDIKECLHNAGLCNMKLTKDVYNKLYKNDEHKKIKSSFGLPDKANCSMLYRKDKTNNDPSKYYI